MRERGGGVSMAKIEVIAELIKSIGLGNKKRARAIIENMVRYENESGKTGAGLKLQYALRTWGDACEMAELPQNAKQFVFDSQPQKNLTELFISGEIHAHVKRLAKERARAEELRLAGLPLKNKVLLAGPPGNGKTSLAGAIAKYFSLPFFVVKSSELIDCSLGGSGKNIANLFEAVRERECVLFMDELDSIGSCRVGSSEGADRERNSILTSILTNVDNVSDACIVIGATNMPDSLDPALMRRFSLKIWMDNPSEEDILTYVQRYQIDRNINFWLSDEDISSLHGHPWSRVEEFCFERHRSLILDDNLSGELGWVGAVKEGA